MNQKIIQCNVENFKKSKNYGMCPFLQWSRPIRWTSLVWLVSSSVQSSVNNNKQANQTADRSREHNQQLKELCSVTSTMTSRVRRSRDSQPSIVIGWPVTWLKIQPCDWLARQRVWLNSHVTQNPALPLVDNTAGLVEQSRDCRQVTWLKIQPCDWLGQQVWSCKP